MIAELHQATVSVAYRGFFPGRPLPTRAELVEVWTGRLAWPGAVALVARFEGQPAGSVMAHPDPAAGGGQLAGLHVLPARWGQGIGSVLHDAALTLLAQAGHTACCTT